MLEIIKPIIEAYPIAVLVAGILGSLVVIGQAVVVLTPSKADDAAWAKLKAIPLLGQLLDVLAHFAPIQKK